MKISLSKKAKNSVLFLDSTLSLPETTMQETKSPYCPNASPRRQVMKIKGVTSCKQMRGQLVVKYLGYQARFYHQCG